MSQATLSDDSSMDSETNPEPETNTDWLRLTLREEPELARKMLEGEDGYGPDVYDAVLERFTGDEFPRQTIYTFRARQRDELEEFVEEEEERDEDLSWPSADNVTTVGEETSTAELSAAEGSPSDALIDTEEESSGPVTITHRCSLCGYEAKARRSVSHHITNEDDPLHRDRDGREGHLIEVVGEPYEESGRVHPAFESEEVRSSLDDGFDVLWTIYQNPTARQGDIAEILDISNQTLRRRLDGLGVDWQSREEDVQELIDGLWDNGDEEEEELEDEEGEVWELDEGNVKVSSPITGVDTTSGRPTQNIADRPVKGKSSETLTIEMTREEAVEFLSDNHTTVKRRVIHELLNTE